MSREAIEPSKHVEREGVEPISEPSLNQATLITGEPCTLQDKCRGCPVLSSTDGSGFMVKVGASASQQSRVKTRVETRSSSSSPRHKHKTAPLTKRTVVQWALPASLDTWQVYLAESLGLTEWRSRELEDTSFLTRHFPPVKTSFSSLNHFTVRGAEPVKADSKSTRDPGEASCDLGLAVKAGGSGVIWEGTQQTLNAGMDPKVS